MTSLFSIVPAGSDSVDLPTLEEAVFSGDVLIDCLTDEELYWLRQREASDDPAMDEPYLSSLDESARRVATDSGLRSLIAKGMVDVDADDPGYLEFIGAYAVLADLRRSALTVTRLRLDVPDEESVRYAFSSISDGLILTEEVADGGFHDFVLQSPASAAVSLASIFDRHRTAGRSSGAIVRVADREEMSPSSDDLAAGALHTVLVRSGGSADHDGGSLFVQGLSDGVYVSWRSDGERPHTRARMGRSDLESLAFDLMMGEWPS